ncbi:MAG: TVP38/TMEM64 family protein [Alphaproteobacteria bacterium]
MDTKGHDAAKPHISLGRLLPVLVLVVGLVLAYAFGVHDYLSFDSLRDHREELTAWVARDWLRAVLVYMAVYAVVVALSLPGGALLTIVGGFLFGTIPGALAAVIGATTGATVVFLAARTAFHDMLHAWAGPFLSRMESGFKANAFNYLLVLRLVPLFPFWLVNLVPAFLGVTLRTFVLGTAIGIIPGAVVYASFGNGLGALIDAGVSPDLSVIFKPAILVPIIGLALLALVPVAYRWHKSRRSHGID